MEELDWLYRSPRWVKRWFFRFIDFAFFRAAQKPLNKFRREIDVPPVRNFFDEAINGAQGIAALFPEWYAEPQPDWPAHLRPFGFPISHRRAELPAEVETFLSAGEPPLVWTHGSANFDIEHFQKRAIAASRELGLRCLLVSLDRPKGSLPEGIFHASHARFEDLFPRAQAVVHHGGIGTTSKCILAGVPQLIIPRSHDQPDNAQRIVRLGLGNTLRYKDIDTPALIETLRRLLNSPFIPENCRRYREKMQTENRLPALCDWAEALAKPSAKSGINLLV
jgi:rhamnosyltransferase subunit B